VPDEPPDGNRLRKDAKTGAMVPAHHITNVTATVDGKTVLEAEWGGGISKNPYLAFKVKGAAKGGKVVVNWVDNTGDKNTAEATIG
jgi:sulfur-oxidizing protein SoxZ